MKKVHKTEREWESILTPDEFKVTRRKGTERAFTGEYWDLKESGIYCCRCCGSHLFSSETKFDSGTGWPSFYRPVSEKSVSELEDRKFGMIRTEVICSVCDAHLGHVFNDGPEPTGLRYCMNSVSMKFKPASDSDG